MLLISGCNYDALRALPRGPCAHPATLWNCCCYSTISTSNNGLSRLQLIIAYCDKGFSNSEILILLFVYDGFKLCMKQLHRILKQNKRRRKLQ